MSKQQEYEQGKLSFTVSTQAFRNYVVDRVNNLEPADQLLKKYSAEISIPQVNEALQAYHTKFEKGKGGLFSKDTRQPELEKILSSFYDLQLKSQDLAPEFRDRLKKSMTAAGTYSLEAKLLLSGTTLIPVEAAAAEIKTLQKENSLLRDLNQALNTSLKNLIENVKARFGLKEQEIDNMIKTPAPALEKSAIKELTKNVNTVQPGLSR